MLITLLTPGPSGQAYKATVQRTSDGFYRDAGDETFTNAPSFATKGITMAEGSAENLGSYTGVVDPTTWTDGYYAFRTHDTNQSNKTIGATLFNVKNGLEASAGVNSDYYYADIQFMASSTSGTDSYVVNWFKNNLPVATGVTSPTLEVVKYSDGSDVIAASAMNQIGALCAFKYTASGAQRIVDGFPVVVVAAASISGVSVSWKRSLGRDN